jgi:hypothetical protein
LIIPIDWKRLKEHGENLVFIHGYTDRKSTLVAIDATEANGIVTVRVIFRREDRTEGTFTHSGEFRGYQQDSPRQASLFLRGATIRFAQARGFTGIWVLTC